MPTAKQKKRVIKTTSEELAATLKELGFVTKKEVKSLILKEVYKITKNNFANLSKHLQELNAVLKRKFLGKSRYFVVGDPYSAERNLH